MVIKITSLTILFLSLFSCKNSLKFPEGGYNYPNYVNKKDSGFLCLPLIDFFTKKDSFLIGFEGKHILQSFDEPNLSLCSRGKTIFRLIDGSSFIDSFTIITLTENKIIVKRKIHGFPYPVGGDTSKLSELEKLHYRILNFNFPIDQSRLEKRKPEYADSLTKIYPQLLDANYYEYLITKSNISGNEKFEYSTKVIPISNNTFLHLIDLINSSEYWSLPHHIKCKNETTDGDGFILEANTPQQYKIVFAEDYCPDEYPKFKKACKELIKDAELTN